MEKLAPICANHAMEARQLEKLRPCGRLETYSTARHHLGFYNNVGLAATYTTSFEAGTSLETLVYAALHHVIAEHSNLSTIPVNEDKSYPDVYFARLPEIDLRTCVEFCTRSKPFVEDDKSDNELLELMNKQHARNFKHNPGLRPYWRLVVATSPKTPLTFTALWFFHHALCDGVSAMLFHESFLEGLNAASLLKEIAPVVQTPSTQAPPPLEELNAMTISWPFLLRAVAGSVLPSYFAQRTPNLWTGYPIDTIIQTPAPPCNQAVVLSAEMTRAFVQKCRDKGTSVTAALSTLLSGFLFGLTAPQNEFRINIPISLRHCLPISDRQMTNAITNASITFHCTGDLLSPKYKGFSWETARLAKEQLTAEVQKKGSDNPIALLKYVSNIHEYFLDKMGKPRDSSVEISNLGFYRPQKSSVATARETKWSIGRMTFSQSPNMTGAQICVSIVTGGDGCMVMNFAWPEEMLQHEKDGGENLLHYLPRVIKGNTTALLEDKDDGKLGYVSLS